MNRLLESLFFLLQNYFVFIFFYVRTFVTYAQNHSRVAAWPDWKRTERKNKEYVVANEISLTLFPTLQGDSPWPNETILSLLVIISYFFFLGLREWNFTILLEKVTHYFAWNLFIVVGKRQKSVALSFSLGNQFRFDQFLFLSRPKNFILLFSSF